MKRLTEYVNGTPAIILHKLDFHFQANGAIGGDIARKLAAYEDTELEPEDIKVLKVIHGLPAAEIVRICNLYRAEKDGRLVELPCRMDATVFDIRRFYKGRKIVRQEVVSGEIDHFTIGEAMKPIAPVCLQGNEWADYEPDDLILTREKAEAELC